MTSEASTDKRIQKTRKALREAFFELVLTYSYDEIKVSDIIAKADIGRSTFYQHYTSKDDILACSMSFLLDSLANSIDVEDNSETLVWLMEHFWQNRKFAPKIFAGTARRIVVQALTARIEVKLKTQIKAQQPHPKMPINIVAHQIAETQLVTVIDWLLGKGRCTANIIAHHIEASTKSLCAVYLSGR